MDKRKRKTLFLNPDNHFMIMGSNLKNSRYVHYCPIDAVNFEPLISNRLKPTETVRISGSAVKT